MKPDAAAARAMRARAGQRKPRARVPPVPHHGPAPSVHRPAQAARARRHHAQGARRPARIAAALARCRAPGRRCTSLAAGPESRSSRSARRRPTVAGMACACMSMHAQLLKHDASSAWGCVHFSMRPGTPAPGTAEQSAADACYGAWSKVSGIALGPARAGYVWTRTRRCAWAWVRVPQCCYQAPRRI